MNNDLHVHYDAVLGAERAERERIRAEISSLNQQLKQKDAVIAALAASLNVADGNTRTPVKAQPASSIGVAVESLPYAGISVRWAILNMMSEHQPAGQLLGTAELAEKLVAGGVRSGAGNFAANVSAVVSDMVKNREELEPADDGKYRLTQKGRETWMTIRTSRRYRGRRFGHYGPMEG